MKPYMAGIMEMKKGQPLYADANLTLRVTYGKVEGYQPPMGFCINIIQHFQELWKKTIL
jgi:hypothetical protein